MKTLSVICYAIGCILLMISCFTVSISLTWWLGGIAVAFLIGGCVFQFNVVKESQHNRYY
ncbi:MAG: hypothetical protein K2L11_05930 [Muribaculaceae bacterium]|nr:hypothetical protein [Muribaculaceae bacterium]